jgi:Protein of unknown function (DUF1566)
MSALRALILTALTLCASACLISSSHAQTELSLFIVQQDRLVDVSRHIEWLRCPLGQKWVTSACRGTALALSLDDTQKAIALIDPHNTTQWRLPSRDELASLKCTTCPSQNLVPALSSIARGVYWSGDENLWAPGYFWTMNLNNFSAYGRNPALARHYVLLVRTKDIPHLPQADGKDGVLTK